jgi:hypothetical protein
VVVNHTTHARLGAFVRDYASGAEAPPPITVMPLAFGVVALLFGVWRLWGALWYRTMRFDEYERGFVRHHRGRETEVPFTAITRAWMTGAPRPEGVKHALGTDFFYTVIYSGGRPIRINGMICDGEILGRRIVAGAHAAHDSGSRN